jgi:hypothetical protein
MKIQKGYEIGIFWQCFIWHWQFTMSTLTKMSCFHIAKSDQGGVS